METSGRRERRWPRRLLFGILGFVVLFYLGGGWYFSGVLNDRALDGAARRASMAPAYDLTIASITPTMIVLHPDGAPPTELDTEGTFGLRWDGGYGQVTHVLSATAGDVTRSFTVIDGSAPRRGDGAELDARAYPSIEAVGVPFRAVTVKGGLGPFPSWEVRPAGEASSTSVILVHGNSMSRLDVVRFLPTLRDAGYPTLTISYRNDPGAPEDPSGKLRYGLTEWRDLQDAVRYALRGGAEHVALYGDSMGGGVIAAFLQRSKLASSVTALILDAPMLNFSATVDDNASREPLIGPIKLPSSLTAVAKRITSWRFGVDWGATDYLTTPGIFDVPTLVFHGTEDTTVPIATSEELAALRPDSVTLVRCEGANHIECWNLDPDAFDRHMVAFLKRATGV
jgi:pimeloyl-ACP methyl ester carboxylesterase